MKILFITSSRIGDAVLSTGVLSYITDNYPNAKVTIACAPLVASLFAGYPQLDRVIKLSKQKHHGHWTELWKQVIGTRWDMVIDIRDSAVSRLIFAKQRFVFSSHIDKDVHKVEQMAALMKVPSEDVPPKLWFSEAQAARAQEIIAPIDGGKIIAVGSTANWLGKTWSVDRFIEVVAWLRTREEFTNSRVAVFAAPSEESPAQVLLASLPKGVGIDVIAKTTPAEAAACLSLCDLYIGNDSGLMHCAAASGVPTFGLFGPSYPHIYAPWGDHCAYAQTPKSFDELIDYDGYTPQSAPCLMDTLTVTAVKAGLTEFLKD